MALYKPPSSFEKEEGCLSGGLLIMILGAVITGLCVVGGYVVLRRRRSENTVPVTRRLEELTKAVQQLQALMHVENSLTREAMHDEFAREFKDFGARVQAVMNKVMQVSETVLLFSDRLDVLESELKKALAEFKTAVVDATTKMGTRLSSFHTDTLKSLKDYVEELKAELRSTAKTLGDRVKEDTGGAVMDCQKTLQHMLMPMKSAQDKHAATWNDKFTEVMKELANTPYRLSKESKDIQAQVRWCQQTADKIQQATEHLPDRLGYLRGMLERVEDVLESVSKQVAPADEEVKEGSPQGPRDEQATGSTQAPTWTTGGAPRSMGPPTMLNLDESLPVQSVGRPSALVPITLPDGRVCYIPRQVLQQLLGHA